MVKSKERRKRPKRTKHRPEKDLRPTPTPGLSMKDPIAEMARQLEERERENKQLMEQVRNLQKQMESDKEEILRQSKELIEQSRQGMTPRDLAKARKAYAAQQAKEIQEQRAELQRKARELLTGPRLSYTPMVDDKIPYGSAGPGKPIIWVFEAGKEGKYPRIVIQAFEDRQRQLAEWRRTKGAYGAAGPGYGGSITEVLIDDLTGSPRRPAAEHQALLAQKGIKQTFTPE